VTEEAPVLPVDRRLLGALARTPNVVRAARQLGIGRDRAVYRLRRLGRLLGRPVATTRHGGPGGGTTTLTALGRRLARDAAGGRARANRWVGEYRRGPPPSVDLGEGRSLEVAFHAHERHSVTVEVDPEAWVLARHPVELSARNAVRAIVAAVRRRADGTAVVAVRWGSGTVRATVTVGSVRRLGLAPGRRVVLYAKATAVRRVD